MAIWNLNAVYDYYAPSFVVLDGLVLYIDAGRDVSYPGSGTIVFDLSTYETDVAVYQATFSDNYFEFDGVDDNLYISSIGTNAPQIANLTNTISGDVFFYPYSTGGDDSGALMRCGILDDVTFSLFYGRTNDSIFFQYNDGSFQSASSSSSVITQDQWNCASFVRDGSSITFYVNGSFVNTVTGLTNPTKTPVNFGIGASRAGGTAGSTTQDLAGRISTVKIYDRALSSDEVLRNFQGIRGRYGI